MEYTVRLQDGDDLVLTDVGISTEGDQIAFSINGQIDDIDDELMNVFSDNRCDRSRLRLRLKKPMRSS